MSTVGDKSRERNADPIGYFWQTRLNRKDKRAEWPTVSHIPIKQYPYMSNREQRTPYPCATPFSGTCFQQSIIRDSNVRVIVVYGGYGRYAIDSYYKNDVVKTRRQRNKRRTASRLSLSSCFKYRLAKNIFIWNAVFILHISRSYVRLEFNYYTFSISGVLEQMSEGYYIIRILTWLKNEYSVQFTNDFTII